MFNCSCSYIIYILYTLNIQLAFVAGSIPSIGVGSCGWVAYPLHPDVIKFKSNLSVAFLLSMKWPRKCSEQLTSFIFHSAADKFNMTVTEYSCGNRSASIRQQSKVKWHSHRQHRQMKHLLLLVWSARFEVCLQVYALVHSTRKILPWIHALARLFTYSCIARCWSIP